MLIRATTIATCTAKLVRAKSSSTFSARVGSGFLIALTLFAVASRGAK